MSELLNIADNNPMLGSTLDAIGHDIVVLDTNNTVLFINIKGKLNLFKSYKRSEINTFDVLVQELLHTYTVNGGDELLALVDKTGKSKSFVTEATKMHVEKGSGYFYEAKTAPIVIDSEGQVGRIWQFLDITDEEKAIEDKTEFLSIASHQLRTPITSLKGYSDMLQNGDFGTIAETQLEPIKAIYESAERMGTLINDLLNLSRMEKTTRQLERTQADLYEVTKRAWQDVAPKANAKQMALSLSPGKAPIVIDPEKIREAFKNILDNAVKYGFEKTNVVVHITQNQNETLISFENQGVGIPQVQQDKLFTKFFRASNVLTENFEGTGLGLYYVHEVIEAHEGAISVESEENKTTRFTIRIPNNEAVQK